MAQISIINQESLKEYSKNIAKILEDDFFKQTDIINGKEILKFSTFTQINLFIVDILFKEWQREVIKLKSPYFDYSTAQVQQALQNFMNILSQNISIKKSDFTILLEEAIYNTIWLILDPKSYYISQLKGLNLLKVDMNLLKSVGKYIQIHRSFFNIYFSRLEQNIDFFAQQNIEDDIFIFFEKFYEGNNHFLENIDSYLNRLKEIKDINWQEILVDYSPQISTQEPEKNNYYPQAISNPDLEKIQTNSAEVNSVSFSQYHPYKSEQIPATVTDHIKNDFIENQSTSEIDPETFPATATDHIKNEFIENQSTSEIDPETFPATVTDHIKNDFIENQSTSEIDPETFPASVTDHIKNEFIENQSTSEIDPETFPDTVTDHIKNEFIENQSTSEIDPETFPATVSDHIKNEFIENQSTFEIDPETFPATVSDHIKNEFIENQSTSEIDPETFPTTVSDHIKNEFIENQSTSEIDPETFPATVSDHIKNEFIKNQSTSEIDRIKNELTENFNNDAKKVNIESPIKNINEIYGERNTSETILEKYQNQSYKNIRLSISLNQKYLFVQNLFNNDTNKLNQMLDRLDSFVDIKLALEFLQVNYTNALGWDSTSESYLELMKTIDKKFS